MNKINFKSNACRYAFTMAEALIAILIVALLAIVLILILKNLKPDENDAMNKKAINVINRVINELITDNYLYPQNSNYEGFGNISKVEYNGYTHEGDTKFCTLFASRLNLAPGSKPNCAKDQKTLTSIEGIDWYIPISFFNADEQETIKIDVNGDNPPNCLYNAAICKTPDQFEYKIPRGLKTERLSFIPSLPPTLQPPARPVSPPAPEPDTKTQQGQESYSIDCQSNGKAKIYGAGDKKVNGNYTLVAIPSKGYKCNWFTKQVTVKDADVTDCQLDCQLDTKLPKPDGGTVIPDPPPVVGDDDDDEPEDEKTFCITKEVTGDKDGCTISGKNPKECGLKAGKYSFSSDVKAGYSSNWAIKDVVIKDKDETLTLECKKDKEEKCYNITADITGQCAVDGAGCKVPGTYSLTITPSNNYTYNSSTSASNYQVIVSNADVNVKITCEPPAVSEEDADPCCEKAFGIGAKYIKKSNKCVRDLGIIRSELSCKNYPQYCKDGLVGTTYVTRWLSANVSCADSGMSLPAFSDLSSLYNNRPSVFTDSDGSDWGYWSTTYGGEPQGCPTFRYLYVPPASGRTYKACVTHPHLHAMCSATAPAICSSAPGPDSGSDNGSISVSASGTSYTVIWSGVSGSRKYVVTGTSVMDYDKPYYTYYGVTNGESGSHSGTVTNLPSFVEPSGVYVSVKFTK